MLIIYIIVLRTALFWVFTQRVVVQLPLSIPHQQMHQLYIIY